MNGDGCDLSGQTTRVMDTFTIVRPEHLNHHGSLFGGSLLRWVDEFAWIAAAKDFPGYRLVTRALDRVEFTTSVANGAILRFRIQRAHRRTTSATYSVDVYADEAGASEDTAEHRSTAGCMAWRRVPPGRYRGTVHRTVSHTSRGL